MNYTLKNDSLLVTISSLGAEVQSVKNVLSGEELWWNGDPAYWHGHSPILFPACGGLWNGKYTYNSKWYEMPKHGFAKKMQFNTSPGGETVQTVQEGTKVISFILEGNEETAKVFPFKWRLTITYTLLESQLQCEAKVENLGDETMHYQLGGHPALALPDYPFEDKDSITPDTTIGYLKPMHLAPGMTAQSLSVIRAGEQGCWSPERYHVTLCKENGMIPVNVETFRNEALIYDGAQLHGFQLYRADGETPVAEVFFDAPACLVWQMTDLLCPYVCIEPWYGLPDRQQCTMPLDYRPYSLHTMPHEESTHFLWGISF